MSAMEIATPYRAAQIRELRAIAAAHLGARHPLAVAIGQAALADNERRLRALLDAVPALRARHLRAAVDGSMNVQAVAAAGTGCGPAEP